MNFDKDNISDRVLKKIGQYCSMADFQVRHSYSFTHNFTCKNCISSVSVENLLTAFDIFFQEAKKMIYFDLKSDAEY